MAEEFLTLMADLDDDSLRFLKRTTVGGAK